MSARVLCRNSALRSSLRNASISRSSYLAPLRATSTQFLANSPKPLSRPSFSTMAPLQSGAPPPSGPQSYDPEIQDMANYIHSYSVNSDLAVR